MNEPSLMGRDFAPLKGLLLVAVASQINTDTFLDLLDK